MSGEGKGWSLGKEYVPRTKCKVCDKMFYAPPSQRKRGGGIYCSNKCFGADKKQDWYKVPCKSCGSVFETKFRELRECVNCEARRYTEKCLKIVGKVAKIAANQIAKVHSLPYMLATKESSSADTRICETCGGAVVGHLNKIFCSDGCIPKTIMQPNSCCAKCGAPFYRSPGHAAKGHGLYCSIKCRPVSGYTVGKGGTRSDIGIYVRSSWEANYARYLNFLVENKIILKWEYEPETFVFHAIKRGIRSYTPDFLITENDGTKVFHEVKGYMDDKSKVKLARMAKYYPEHKVIVIANKEMRELKVKVAALIPMWEYGENDKLGYNRVRKKSSRWSKM